MMVYENDKLNIPDEYLKMSVRDLDRLKKETLKQIISDREKGVHLPKKKKDTSVTVNWH